MIDKYINVDKVVEMAVLKKPKKKKSSYKDIPGEPLLLKSNNKEIE